MSEAAQKTAVETGKPETFAAKGFGAKSSTSGLSAFSFKRRAPLADDVQIEILYCGVCHSDLHLSRDEWKDGNAGCVSGCAWARNRRSRGEGRAECEEV